MTTYIYGTESYATLAELVKAHPAAVSSLVRVRRDGGLFYLNRADDDALFALLKSQPATGCDQASIEVRLLAEQHAAVVGAANAAGLSVREWAAKVLVDAAATAYVGAVTGLTCPMCNGAGHNGERIGRTNTAIACRTCNGTGEIELR